MSYMDVFEKYLDNTIGLNTADIEIKKMLSDLLETNDVKEYVKASMCITYFKRYQQYNSGLIGPKDLLLFIRDFVLFLGRFRFPRLITDVVERNGDDLGVFIAQDGATDVVEKFPDILGDGQRFVKEVYSLGNDGENVHTESGGDDYVCRFTRFLSYHSLEQKIAVHSALELPDNHTLMISLPTGGGKSLVTQLLAAIEQKLTIVVVPTVSLAKDQCLQAISSLENADLKKNVLCYQSDTDNTAIINGIKNETARLVFTSPEAILKNTAFNKELRNAAEKGYLHNVVIDEAHIVLDWGVHFRPDFQIFSIVLKEWKALSNKAIRTYLLSATLSDDVVDVLFDLFGSESNNIQFRCDALRKEPRYVICENHNYDEREDRVIEMIKSLPKPLIVYVIEPTTANRYYKKLKRSGFTNIHTYTGDTSDQDRETLLEGWKNNNFDVMIATSAFGMGVDKSNVRTVIHACVPENLSRFYQEVGRAGRDGLPSLSVLSYYTSQNDNRNDLTVAFGLVNKSILKKENLLIRLDSILNDEKTVIDGDKVTADLNTVPNSFTDDEAQHAGMRNMCWNANTLLLLHRRKYIDISEAQYDAKEKTYLFTFKINDIDLLHDRDRLSEELTEDRQREYEMRVAGYHKMADLVHRPKAKCWGKYFVSLYPFAQPICKGCPVHPEGSSIKEDRIRIRDKSIVHIEPNEPGLRLKRYMGALNDLLIPVEDYSNIEMETVIEKANRIGVACIIHPDQIKISRSNSCMSLSHSEFLVIANKVPWVLRNGMFTLLSDDNGINNKVFEAANNMYVQTYRKVWCCKLDTFITTRNRTINEFLNCRTRSLNSL